MVTLPTGIMFFCSLAFGFGCGEFYEDGPRVNLPLKKWSAITEILRNALVTSRGVNIWELRNAHHTYIQALHDSLFWGLSSLHSEFWDRLMTIGVATPGVGLWALCRNLYWGSYLLHWKTSLSVGVILVVTPDVGLHALCLMLPWGKRL